MGVIPQLHRAVHSVGTWTEQTLAEEHIGQADALVLTHLVRHPNSSINDLHHQFGHRRSTLTNIVDRLERQSLLQRVHDPHNRRLVRLELTPQGVATAHDVTELFDWLEKAIGDRVTPEAIRGFHEVIGAIEEAIRD
jgi:DNA-binding MarR family transcriptional regulator